MRVFTIQMGSHRLAKEQRIILIDTTVKSGDKAFAPTWDMVNLVKDNTVDGVTSVDALATYECLYRDLMRQSQLDNPKQWFGLFHQGSIALACYCKAGNFCHRLLLVDILTEYAEAQGLSIEAEGEIMSSKFTPVGDGVDHINVYSKGRTELGRSLSHMSSYGFVHEQHGEFKCLEGYYYYLAYMLDGSNVPFLSLANMDGFTAKKVGKAWLSKLNSEDVFGTSEFRELFLYGHKLRLEQNGPLRERFMESDKPLAHYYYYGNIENPKVIDAGGVYYLKYLEQLKKEWS